MFVLLEHERPSDPAAPAQRDVHWDLLVEVPGQDRLPTWQLTEDPCRAIGPIPARRIADHRRIYLEYEGPLSEGRGVVRRVDRGPADVERLDLDGLIVALHGAHLHGRFAVTGTAGGQAAFVPCPARDG